MCFSSAANRLSRAAVEQANSFAWQDDHTVLEEIRGWLGGRLQVTQADAAGEKCSHESNFSKAERCSNTTSDCVKMRPVLR